MGASSLKCNSLAEDIKLSAHGRHLTSYPFYFFVCLFYFYFCFLVLFVCFCLFFFSFVTLVFCFSGTSVLEFKFGGGML